MPNTPFRRPDPLPPLTPAGMLARLQSPEFKSTHETAIKRLRKAVDIDRIRLKTGQVPMGCHLSLAEAESLDQTITLLSALLLTLPPVPREGRN